MMKKYFFVLIIIFSFLTTVVFAENTDITTGFIPGQIWYSKEPLVAGEIIKIYTAVWNGNKDNLSIKVEFYDRNVILGSRDIVILPEQVKEVFISWEVTSGDHIISAKIISSNINNGTKKESVILDRNETEKNSLFVPVVVMNENGKPVTSSDVFKNQLEKTGSEIKEIIPSSFSTVISSGLNTVDNFRSSIFDEISKAREKTRNEIDLLNKGINSDKEKVEENNDQLDPQTSYIEMDTLRSIKKPIAQVKLFLLSILSFIIGHVILFYIVLLIIISYIFRFIFYSIKNK